ncbi:MAG: glycosyltransferase family 9 protein [Prevotella sp.]|jgi:ADP-heptose:LPS heptosyltransferase|nr:glycosyltransferase family 9 protein [Prevotella sp.]MBP8757122.1 glycosyltransferase family 9 protein [Prevotella sp.]MBP9984634.1 glycosyltransferase family 9 protein [Prevotella sp.]MDY0153635.1 glycosyltransferase family 9 protein [Prevotella sp.]
MNTEHLLIMRFSALGDVAMTVPVVYSLACQYPNLRITMLSKPFARPFFENLAPNVGFMAADINNEYHGVRGLNSLYRRLTAKNFTAIADFHSVLRSDYLRMRFNFDHYRVESIDKHRSGKSKLIAENNKELKQQPTSFQNYTDVLEKLGYPVKLEFKSIYPPEGGNLRLLSDKIGEKRPFQQWIGIAPFAAHKGKMYPLPLMKNVIRMLVNKHPSSRIFLFGGGSEEMIQLDAISAESKQIINASRLMNGLQQELILMSHLDVMVSMDSANMHLASLVNTPVVSIWGSTHPFAGFMGWNQSMDRAVQLDMPCRPCSIYGNKPCLRGDWACMHNIKPEVVVEHVERILQTK